MASAAQELSEPRVLAHAKRRLFPEDRAEHYVVTDTQFSTTEWLSSRSVDAAITEALAPFNHVQIGSGYPDLVGVGTLENELLAVDRLGDDPPLVVVEAKGYRDDGRVDVERGIAQAHD